MYMPMLEIRMQTMASRQNLQFAQLSRLISLIPVVVTLLVTTILAVLIREQGRTIANI